MNNLIDKIQELEESIKNGETIIIQAEARASALRPQYAEILKEIKELGFNPEKIEEEIKELDLKIESKIKEIENSINKDVIEKFTNFDFNKDISEIPNLELDF